MLVFQSESELESELESESVYLKNNINVNTRLLVWGCCSQSLSQKLQKLQNRAARVITFSNFDSCTEELFRELRWVKLDRQRSVDKAIMVYNIVNGAVPQYFCSRFVQRSDTLSYQLRGSDHRFAIPLPRTNYCKRSLTCSGAVLWNGLLLGLKQSSSLDLFKSGLKCHVFQSELP